VGPASFDRKFGAQLVRELPPTPAVYLFKDEGGNVLYAGKAKNIRRRLQGYRNATARKAHRKMRRLLRAASALEVRLQASERDALLLENELIRTLRPRFNVDGAYSFLYPAIGIGVREHRAFLCFTTRIAAFSELELRWHGSFRSRSRTLAAFEALIALLELLGHREPSSRLREVPRIRGSRTVAFRRIECLVPSLHHLLSGESKGVLQELTARLLEKPAARRAAADVGERLRRLDAFFETDARRLRDALRTAGRRDGFVYQEDRDALFIAQRQAPAREVPVRCASANRQVDGQPAVARPEAPLPFS
jgi:excinuclease ABC subunit C